MTDDLSKSTTLVQDPVCGMKVDSSTAKHRNEHNGKSYYFCCGHCAEKFKTDPEKYLSQAVRPASSSLVTLGAPTVRSVPASVASPSAPQTTPPTQAHHASPLRPPL